MPSKNFGPSGIITPINTSVSFMDIPPADFINFIGTPSDGFLDINHPSSSLSSVSFITAASQTTDVANLNVVPNVDYELIHPGSNHDTPPITHIRWVEPVILTELPCNH
jgi:hypothetical protein